MMAGITAACRRRKIGVVLAVFAGQSNMRGYSTTGSDVPIDLQGTDSGARIWSGTSGTIELYEAGVNSDAWTSGTSTPQKWGPEAAFLKAFRAANPSTEIIAVKLAVDASYLDAVSGSDWNAASSGELLDALKTEVAAAKSAIAGEGKTITETVFLWMQGEADADDSSGVAYAGNLSNLIANVRSTIGSAETSILIGRILPIPGRARASSVRAFITRIADDTSGVWAIDTDGYAVAGDNVHFQPTGLKALGDDMFAAYSGSYQHTIAARFDTHPSSKNASIVLTNGNLTAEGGGTSAASYQLVRCDKVLGLSGKFYIEFKINAQIANLNVGIAYSPNVSEYFGQQVQGVGYVRDGGLWKNSTKIGTYATYGAGDTIMLAFDGATGKVWFGTNGTWSGDPAAGTGHVTTISPLIDAPYPRTGVTLRRSGDKATVKVTAADWAYPPPSGFGSI